MRKERYELEIPWRERVEIPRLLWAFPPLANGRDYKLGVPGCDAVGHHGSFLNGMRMLSFQLFLCVFGSFATVPTHKVVTKTTLYKC